MLKKVSFLWWQKRGTSLQTQEKAKALSYAAVAPQAAKKAKKPKVVWPWAASLLSCLKGDG